MGKKEKWHKHFRKTECSHLHTLQVSTLAWGALMLRAALVWDSCGVLISENTLFVGPYLTCDFLGSSGLCVNKQFYCLLVVEDVYKLCMVVKKHPRA